MVAKPRKQSLYALLGSLTALVVVVVLGIHGALMIRAQTRFIVEENDRHAAITLARLQQSLAPFVESYAINEYENLIAKEIALHDFYDAILVHDINMGHVLGQETYVTGRLRTADGRIVDYDPDDATLAERLTKNPRLVRGDIVSSSGETIGMIHCCPR